MNKKIEKVSWNTLTVVVVLPRQPSRSFQITFDSSSSHSRTIARKSSLAWLKSYAMTRNFEKKDLEKKKKFQKFYIEGKTLLVWSDRVGRMLWRRTPAILLWISSTRTRGWGTVIFHPFHRFLLFLVSGILTGVEECTKKWKGEKSSTFRRLSKSINQSIN